MAKRATSFPKHKINVLLLEGIHEEAVRIFSGDGFTVRSEAKALEGKKLAEAVADVHVLGIRSKTQVSEGVLLGAKRLIGVGCFCIGTDQVALSSAAGLGVPVFNAPFSNTRSVAELVVSEVIALHRRLMDVSRGCHEGRWDKSAEGCHEVRGRTIGIVGYGHIGSQVSVLAEAMGMRVRYFDVVDKLPLGNAQAVGSLGELLESSDVVTLHVPDTAQTRGMIGARELGRMRPGSFLINNARGGVVDVPALASALKSGHLAGAAVDVFPKEPVGKGESFESELRGLANVILTPHVGGSTAEAQANIARDVSGKLMRFMNNGSTTGAVNVPNVDLPGQSEVGLSGTARGRHHRILHFHHNEPGVMSRVNRVMSDRGVNVAGQYLRTDADIGYVVLDVDPTDQDTSTIERELGEIPETIRTRVLW